MKLSIITINYNNCAGLQATIESVRRQSINDFEYIIIDGGSTDGSKEVILNNKDIVSKWVSEKDKGIYNAMNKGTVMASGDYCLFLNSGDYLHNENSIESIIDLLGDTDFVFGRIIFLDSGRLSEVPEQISFDFMFLNSLPHPSSFIKRELLVKYPYDESYKIVSDWKFFLQTVIIDNSTYLLSDAIISDFDCNGISSTNNKLNEMERKAVIEELFPKRVVLDYLRFYLGPNYTDTTYDKFFIQLRDYRSAKLIYFLNGILLRIVALFKKEFSFVKEYPLWLKNVKHS